MRALDLILIVVIVVCIAVAVVLLAHKSEPVNAEHRADHGRAFGAWAMFSIVVALGVCAAVMIVLIN